VNRTTAVRTTAAAVSVILALALAGCTSNDSLANSYNKTGETGNYVSSDGATTTIAAPDRGKPVSWSGTTDAGTKVASSDYVGKVVVLNFWYASCPPCRAEAPSLEKLNQKYSPKDVVFLGVNVQDTGPTAVSFEKAHGVTYPSILDDDQGSVRLAFHGKVSPNAVPTTLIIDGKGRVAARFSGLITSPSLVGTIIESTQAEAAG
jgi:thiol-disulfide isomerase/thioredoxin